MNKPVQVEIRAETTPTLASLRSALEPGARRRCMANVATRVRTRLRKHFIERQSEGNKRNWPERYFWRGSTGNSVYEKTQIGEVTDDLATIVIESAAFAFKVHGGTILPKRGEFLTLPRTAEAYAAGSPREGGIKGLFVVRRKGSFTAYLCVRSAGRLIGHYRLVRSVRQARDPRALPPTAEIWKAADEAADAYLTTAIRRGK